MLIYLVVEPESSLNNAFIANNRAAYRSHLRGGDLFWEIAAVSPMKEVDILVGWRYVDTYNKM